MYYRYELKSTQLIHVAHAQHDSLFVHSTTKFIPRNFQHREIPTQDGKTYTPAQRPLTYCLDLWTTSGGVFPHSHCGPVCAQSNITHCYTVCNCVHFMLLFSAYKGTHRYSCTCAVLTSPITGGCETFTNEPSTTKSQGDGMNDWREGTLNMMAVLHIHTENHDTL